MVKFCEATPLSSKVAEANTLHFKPFLTPLCKKYQVGYALGRLGHTVACVKIWGRSAP